MLDQEIKRHKYDIDLLRVEIEASLEKFRKYLDVYVTLIDLLLSNEPRDQSLRQS